MLFPKHEQLKARAIFFGQRLDLRAFEQGQRLAETPLMVTAGASGCAALFRYGVAVVFGLNAVEEAAFQNALAAFVIDPFDITESEEVELLLDSTHEGVGQHYLRLKDFSVERLQLVADVLAKSVVMAYYEQRVAESFDRIDPLAADLRRQGRAGRQARELLKHIGQTLTIQGKMVGRVEVTEKPELLWDHPELERLYVRLEDEYELSERHTALERKLDLISRTAETLLSLLMNKRMLHVEWYIVALIVIEILLMLYEIAFVNP